LLYAFVDGTGVCSREHYPGSRAEARDCVDEMVGQCRHIPGATRRRTAKIVGADRVHDLMHGGQCLFDAGEFVHARWPMG